MSTPRRTSSPRLEMAAFVLFAAGIALIQFNIRAEILLGVAGILWGVLAWRDGGIPKVPPFFTPLLALAAATLVSAAFSSDPLYSFERTKQLLLYLIVPVTMRVASGSRSSKVVDAIIALGSAAAIVGVIQYIASTSPEELLQHRPHGLLNHYMTYSGVLMLVICAAVARLLYREREWLWPAIAIPALFVALGVTQTRNVWVGTAVALSALLAARRRVLLFILPVLIVTAAAIAPVNMRDRATSIFDPAQNRDRIAMLKAGVAMVKDHPVFGVGPNMVPRVYLDYRTSDAVDSAEATGPETRSHLHNVPMQLAAERGLIALAIWIWFIVVVIRDLWRLLKNGSHKAIAAAGFAAVIAMLAAGLFEHNFGDSEFLILFLTLITLPFAAEEKTRA